MSSTVKKSPSLRSVYFSSFYHNELAHLEAALRCANAPLFSQGFERWSFKTLRFLIMAGGHDQAGKMSNQSAGPSQGLICPSGTGEKYTEAKPRDFFTTDE